MYPDNAKEDIPNSGLDLTPLLLKKYIHRITFVVSASMIIHAAAFHGVMFSIAVLVGLSNVAHAECQIDYKYLPIQAFLIYLQ